MGTVHQSNLDIRPSCTRSLFCMQCLKRMQCPFGVRLAKLYCDTKICKTCMHENQYITVVGCFEHVSAAAGDAWHIYVAWETWMLQAWTLARMCCQHSRNSVRASPFSSTLVHIWGGVVSDTCSIYRYAWLFCIWTFKTKCSIENICSVDCIGFSLCVLCVFLSCC